MQLIIRDLIYRSPQKQSEFTARNAKKGTNRLPTDQKKGRGSVRALSPPIMVVPRVLHPLQGVLPVHVDKNHTQDGQHEEAEQYKNESEGYLRHGSMRLARCRHDAAPKRVQIGCHKRSREAGGGAKSPFRASSEPCAPSPRREPRGVRGPACARPSRPPPSGSRA